MNTVRILKWVTYVIFTALVIISCKEEENQSGFPKINGHFDAGSLIVKENNATKKVRGQVLYLPIYSHVPYFEHNKRYDLSAFVAIHNTDFHNTLRITKVLYFDNDGKLVADYLKKDTILHPLGATNYFVPEADNSGTGANFIVEWVSDSLINEPLIESVMIGLKFNQGVSFLSSGRIIRESK